MQNRSGLLEEKKREIQAELERWVKKHEIVLPGEQIKFTLKIAPINLVAEESEGKSHLLVMGVEEFFTAERAKAAGVTGRWLTRFINHLPKEISTVGDVVTHRLQMRHWRQFGHLTRHRINQVLRYEGLI